MSRKNGEAHSKMLLLHHLLIISLSASLSEVWNPYNAATLHHLYLA